MNKKPIDHLLRVTHNPEAWKKYHVKASEMGYPLKRLTELCIEEKTGIKF